MAVSSSSSVVRARRWPSPAVVRARRAVPPRPPTPPANIVRASAACHRDVSLSLSRCTTAVLHTCTPPWNYHQITTEQLSCLVRIAHHDVKNCHYSWVIVCACIIHVWFSTAYDNPAILHRNSLWQSCLGFQGRDSMWHVLIDHVLTVILAYLANNIQYTVRIMRSNRSVVWFVSIGIWLGCVLVV